MIIPEKQQEIRLIAIYGRVSTSNQENEGTIETQLSAVKEFATKNGYTIIDRYIDNGWSGDSIARPELDRLRMDAKKKVWDAVLMYDPDRLARRYSYQELVMDELKEAGIEVMFVTISAPKNSEDKILHGVRGLFAEYERAKIAERFRLGKVRKAKEGHVIASEAPYGYTFILKTVEKQGYYLINDEEAKIVCDIFSWVGNEGLTLRKIVRRLKEHCILPRKSKRGVWNTSTLSTLLRNKTYIGHAHFGASYAVVPINPLKKEGYKKIKKTSRRMKPESDWIRISVPKIIEEELFLRVQRRLKENFEASSRNTKNEYLLSHRIWCPCGCRRAGEGPMRGKHLYYRCTSRVKNFPLPSTCEEKGLNARIVDALVWNRVSGLMSSPDLLIKQADRWFKERSTNKSSNTNIDEVTKEVQKLKDQEDRLVKAYGAGVFTIEQLRDYSQPIRDKISTLNDLLVQSKTNNKNSRELSLPEPNQIKQFSNYAAKKLEDLNFEQKRGIISSTVEKIVGTRTELQIHGYIPLNINVFSSNRYSRPSKRW